jgi:site-specific DNA-methyltransferase (adenine-specific)
MKNMKNTLYFGDNLKILRNEIPNDSIDLIYLDPPFNSKADYNILFREPDGLPSQAQIRVFDDSWHWTEEAEKTYLEILDIAPSKVSDMIRSFIDFIGKNDVMAYLTMMCIRLLELHRVLKKSGSIYLHCDPTASHYLKVLMDMIFDKRNFKNEIIWHYRKWPSGTKQFQRNHDVILFYAATVTNDRLFNQVDLMERTESTIKRFGNKKIVSGYDNEGKRIPSKMEETDSLGVPRDDVWDIKRVAPVKQLFPTQKPEPLLSRIIRASSNEGDIILDPFCGCGTTIVEAQGQRRRWIGIDITCLATNLIKRRLKDMFGLIPNEGYNIIGEPEDMSGAIELAKQDRYQFQWWALSLIDHAKPFRDKKKGPDSGIDGILYFKDDVDKIERVVIQVKSGKVSVKDIRDLGHVVEREKSPIGLFITLQPPTKPMTKEAISTGFYKAKLSGTQYPKIQILTIEDLFDGKNPQTPQVVSAYRKAQIPNLQEKLI